MAENVKSEADTGRRDRRISESEMLDVATVERLQNLHALRSQIAFRRTEGEIIPENAAIVIETEKLQRALGQIFLAAAERGDASRLRAFIEHRFPANYADPKTGETALHIVSANGARRALRALLSTRRINHLVRDNAGRMPSELAYLYGEDQAMARLLAIKEKRNAVREELPLTRRPPRARN